MVDYDSQMLIYLNTLKEFAKDSKSSIVKIEKFCLSIKELIKESVEKEDKYLYKLRYYIYLIYQSIGERLTEDNAIELCKRLSSITEITGISLHPMNIYKIANKLCEEDFSVKGYMDVSFLRKAYSILLEKEKVKSFIGLVTLTKVPPNESLIQSFYLNCLDGTKKCKMKDLKTIEKVTKIPLKPIILKYYWTLFARFVNSEVSDKELIEKIQKIRDMFQVPLPNGFLNAVVSCFLEDPQKVYEFLDMVYMNFKEDFNVSDGIVNKLVHSAVKEFFEEEKFTLPKFVADSLDANKVINLYSNIRKNAKKFVNLLYEHCSKDESDVNELYEKLISKGLIHEVELFAEGSRIKLNKKNEKMFLNAVGKESIEEWLIEAVSFNNYYDVWRITTLFNVSREVVVSVVEKLISLGWIENLEIIKHYFPNFLSSEKFREIVSESYKLYINSNWEPNKRVELLRKLYEVTKIKPSYEIVQQWYGLLYIMGKTEEIKELVEELKIPVSKKVYEICTINIQEIIDKIIKEFDKKKKV